MLEQKQIQKKIFRLCLPIVAYAYVAYAYVDCEDKTFVWQL